MINLDNLIALHDNKKAIHRHKRILAELFYLCINDTFLETIDEARVALQNILPDADLVFPCVKEFALQLRNTYLEDTEDYRPLLKSVSARHKYYHPAFIRNYREIGEDDGILDRFNILENIIFFNDPLPEANPLDHFYNRSGFMEVVTDETTGPYIRIQFDLGTTKNEMFNIIEKDFSEISSLQKEQYNTLSKQYRDSGTDLRKKAIIYKQDKLNRNDTQIAVTLDNDGAYGSENIAEQIRSQRNRMQIEVAKYNPYV